MSKDFCMECGMLLSPHTSVCFYRNYFRDVLADPKKGPILSCCSH